MSDQTPGPVPPSSPPTTTPTSTPTTYPPTSYPTASYPPEAYSSTGYPGTTETSPGRGAGAAAVLVLVGAVLAVIVSVGAGVYFLSEWVGQQQGASGPGGAPGAEPVAPLLTPAGYDQFLDTLEEATGSTKVIDATLYPGYASTEVLLPGGKGRTRSLYYDGTISEQNLGTTDDPELDLRRIDGALLETLSKKARKMVEDPTMWYVMLRAADPEGSVITAYASNEYGEGGYVAARVDGKIVRRVTW